MIRFNEVKKDQINKDIKKTIILNKSNSNIDYNKELFIKNKDKNNHFKNEFLKKKIGDI